METLLEKAKTIKTRKLGSTVTHEHIELALAWVNDEISLSQVEQAITGKRSGGVMAYVTLARSLREYIKNPK